jgi:asparagine synthase (glutamine-hydrolysing)
MCGICGFVETGNVSPPETLARMNDRLRHRGPDDEGTYRHGAVSMAMRRLAVIDLGTGHQPIGNETGDVWVVYNGEIYNFQELREGLLARGHTLRTRSDTEVLVHLYEEEGEGFVPRLMGMFAFAIHDRARRRLLFARDRFGEKPLFYHHTPERLVFASEIRSLLEHPSVPRVLDLESLPYYIRTGIMPSPLTLLKGVRSLPPGHIMVATEAGEATVKPYFRLQYTPDPALREPKAAVERVREALTNAVRRQLVSDVPLGAFLSGGIDSSSVVALATRLRPDPIRTFTVRFPGADYDEGEIAAAVATHIGTRHHEHRVERAAFAEDDFWRIIDHVGQPFVDTSAIPTSMVSQVAREQVTVCLSGDGGDEMFAGYDGYQWAVPIQRAARSPRLLLGLAHAALRAASQAPWIPGSARLRRLRRGIEVARLPQRMQMFAMHQMFGEEELEALTVPGARSVVTLPDENLMTRDPPGEEGWSFLRRMLSYSTRFNLEADMLVKVDRMSMVHSLEVRAPFLDPEVAQVAWSLPDELLVRDGVGKWIVRQAVADLLPEVVFRHPKQGFSIPLHRYQNDTYKALVRRILLDRHDLHSVLSREAIERIVALGLDQQSDNVIRSVFRATHQIWLLTQLFGWAQRFGVRTP